MTGVRVLDAATLFAGPLAATFLGDFGADVIKVEHPRGDPVRTHGPTKDGVPLWWKMVGRNKRAITLDLGEPAGAGAAAASWSRRPTSSIENFRPGHPGALGARARGSCSPIDPRLIVLRTTGVRAVRAVRRPPGLRDAGREP